MSRTTVSARLLMDGTLQRLLANGQLRAAWDLSRRIEREGKGDGLSDFVSGVAFYRKHDLAAAQRHFRTAITKDPRIVLAHHYLGLIHERGGANEKAADCYRQVLHIDPSFEDAEKRLANLEHSPSHEPRLSRRRRFRSFQLAMVAMLLLPVSLICIPLVDQHSKLPFLIFVAITFALLLVILHSVLGALTTRYNFYDNRIEIIRGIFLRKRVVIFLFRIEDVWYQRSLINMLTGDAQVMIRAAAVEPIHWRKIGKFKVTGVGGRRVMESLFIQVRDTAVEDRKAVKKWLV